MNAILEVRHLEKYYGEGMILTKAVDGISLTVQAGEFVGIMGDSGSGKTTLLNCISTIDQPTGGKVLIQGQEITKIPEKELASFRRQNLGFVFQEFNLLDTLTVEENIGLSLVINQEDKDETERRVHAVAKLLGIEDTLKKYPYEISGGQKQRCACARAIIHEPSLVLADEPTGALDSHASRRLLDTMENINEKQKATILMVTHDPKSASYCSRVLFLKDGKIFNEIYRGDKSKMVFQLEIMDILTVLGGDEDADEVLTS